MNFTSLFLLLFILFGTNVQARDKFLQNNQASVLEQNSVELLASDLELKELKKQQAKIKKNCLRKATEMEKKRKEHISAWRNYRSNRKAAASLMREVRSIDRTNEQHVSQLQEEINTFAKERLKGKLEKYSELGQFLTFRQWGH